MLFVPGVTTTAGSFDDFLGSAFFMLTAIPSSRSLATDARGCVEEELMDYDDLCMMDSLVEYEDFADPIFTDDDFEDEDEDCGCADPDCPCQAKGFSGKIR